jgi:uncharacterized protein YbbK (DUF523 family)
MFRLGVSACLLGETVRYDGSDRLSVAVTTLADQFELVPLCPEVAIGLGVPRPTIGVFQTDNGLRVHRNDDPEFDVTEDLEAYGRIQADQFLCGFILKSRSPSCGIEDTPIMDSDGETVAQGGGGFVIGLRAADPELPMISDERLLDDNARSQFLDQVLAYARKRQFLE